MVIIIIKRAKEVSKDMGEIATDSMFLGLEEGGGEVVSQCLQLCNPGIYFIIFKIIQRQ